MNDVKETWFKWDYICPNCDAHIEMTLKSNGHPHSEVCSKCYERLTLMSVVDATIYPTTKKEETVEQTIAELYNPTLLVTYKKIENDQTEYVTDKVTDIEWELAQGRRNAKRNSQMNDKVFTLENMLHTYCQEATEPDMAFITEIAELFDISLTKEIEVTGTISFSATVRVSLTDDYDIESMVNDEISVSSYGGDVDVNDFSLDDVRED